MDGLELKCARLLLGLSQEEAAKQIGLVTQRSWAYWESGERTIPLDVADQVQELINRRKAIIQQFKELSENKAKIVVIFYESPQDAGQTLLEMRFNNSLAATLAIDYGVNVVRYNPVDYVNWLTENGLVDSPAKRSEWSVDYFLRQKKG
ncbi:TPA: helix-turn-helix domain-containing protein [Pasteurella multocida]